ncbi:nucleotidyltransferase family protein [Halovenus marina]|uniref:nucleotidyltransferase family protein n=1 Tax=Halovenus marina TaxID=3396621 RepID=UPI003F56D3ED
MSLTDLPVRDPATFPDTFERPDTVIRGVVLAAGTSSRYGAENKLTATVEGEPVVTRATRALVESSLDGVTVVVGHEAERVREAISGLDVTVRVNDNYRAGQSTSLREGIRDASERGADAALIALGDMPWVTTRTVDLLADAYRYGIANILAAAYQGERGNPTLFGAEYFETLADIEGDVGGRELLTESGEAVGIETGDPGVRRDIDHPADLRDESQSA